MAEDPRSIRRWFNPNLVRESLDAYEQFARNSDWSVGHKLELYRAAFDAFDLNLARDNRLAAFNEIYGALRGYWQVFRGAKARWSAETILTTLEAAGGACSRRGPIDLLRIGQGHDISAVSELLAAMREIKTVKGGYFVAMTVSKFLHFFNPCLFAIYDTQVIETKVLRAFAVDWHGFDRRFNVPNLHFPTVYYLRYTCWLADLIAPQAEELMTIFAEWIREAADREGATNRIPKDIDRYFALAAEFICIGAAEVLGR